MVINVLKVPIPPLFENISVFRPESSVSKKISHGIPTAVTAS